MDSSVIPPITGAMFALLLPRQRACPAMAGAVITALGLASLRVAGGPEWQAAGLPSTYLSITAALLLGGLLIPLAHLGRAARAGELQARWLPLLPAAIALLLANGWVLIPLVRAGGFGATGVALVILTAAVVLLTVLARALRLTDRIRRLDLAVFGTTLAPGRPVRGPAELGLLIVHSGLAVAALFAPHLILLLVAVTGAAVTGVVLDRRLGGAGRWPVPELAGLVLLAMGSTFLVQVAGEVPLTLRELREGPFSAAFELSASLLFIAASWPMVGLWPLHSRPRGPATPLAGAAVLGIVAVQILPGGTGHWQPLVFPLLAVAAWYAAGTGVLRPGLAAVAAAGLISLDAGAAVAGTVVLALVAALDVRGRLRPLDRVGRLVRAGVTLGGAGAAVPLLEGALRAQTFYTVLIAAGVTAALTGRDELSSGTV